MKIIALVFSILILTALISKAEENKAKTSSKTIGITQHSDSLSDTDENQPAEVTRVPGSSSDLPYTNEEMDSNSPEKFNSKSMPVDEE